MSSNTVLGALHSAGEFPLSAHITSQTCTRHICSAAHPSNSRDMEALPKTGKAPLVPTKSNFAQTVHMTLMENCVIGMTSINLELRVLHGVAGLYSWRATRQNVVRGPPELDGSLTQMTHIYTLQISLQPRTVALATSEKQFQHGISFQPSPSLWPQDPYSDNPQYYI